MLSPRLRKGLVASGGLLIAAAFAAAFGFDQPLVADVKPRIGRAPQDIVVSTRVWPSDLNRALVVTVISADGDDHASVKELDGSEPIQRTLYYRGVSAGDYLVEVCLVRTDKMFCETRPVQIVSNR